MLLSMSSVDVIALSAVVAVSSSCCSAAGVVVVLGILG